MYLWYNAGRSRQLRSLTTRTTAEERSCDVWRLPNAKNLTEHTAIRYIYSVQLQEISLLFRVLRMKNKTGSAGNSIQLLCNLEVRLK